MKATLEDKTHLDQYDKDVNSKAKSTKQSTQWSSREKRTYKLNWRIQNSSQWKKNDTMNKKFTLSCVFQLRLSHSLLPGGRLRT